VLTGTGGRASKRSLIVRFTVFGRVPCSGARRRGKELDAVSTAIPGGEAARNVANQPRGFFASAELALLDEAATRQTIPAILFSLINLL